MQEKTILDKKSVQRIISRMAHEILEQNKGVKHLVLIGISAGGVGLCRRLHENIKEIEGVDLPVGAVDVTLYRDDISSGSTKKAVGKTDIRFSLNDKTVILIDDVLYTGRTIRAAMDALMDFGRPRAIQLAVFVDRGHRELPIRADYVGKNIPTSSTEKIVLQMTQSGEDSVIIIKG